MQFQQAESNRQIQIGKGRGAGLVSSVFNWRVQPKLDLLVIWLNDLTASGIYWHEAGDFLALRFAASYYVTSLCLGSFTFTGDGTTNPCHDIVRLKVITVNKLFAQPAT